MLRDWGAEKKYHHVLKGFNYRMEGMQGAILRVKLRHLEAWTEARRAHAAAYRRCSPTAACRRRARRRTRRHVYHVYAVRTTDRDALQRVLQARRRRRPASTTRSRSTCSRRTPTSATRRRRLPAVGARGQRGAVAADVSGADARRRSSRSAAAVRAGGVCRLTALRPRRRGGPRPQGRASRSPAVERAGGVAAGRVPARRSWSTSIPVTMHGDDS